MTYIDVKNDFLAILNRRDITPTQVTGFLTKGALRINRTLRIPAMEAKATVVSGASPVALPVPADLLELIDIYTNDQVNQYKLIRTTQDRIILYSQQVGIPKFYYREGTNYLIGPSCPSGINFYINYYQSAATLVNDGDTNWLTQVAPDLWAYAALTYADDYFLDERAPMFEATYQNILEDLRNQALEGDLINASIAPAYNPDGCGGSYGSAPYDYY